MDAAQVDLEIAREQERLYNFLKKYDLHQYYTKFLQKGVHRLTHLKGVLADEASLDEIGLSRIERMRLKKKVKENVAWKGRVMVSQRRVFLAFSVNARKLMILVGQASFGKYTPVLSAMRSVYSAVCLHYKQNQTLPLKK